MKTYADVYAEALEAAANVCHKDAKKWFSEGPPIDRHDAGIIMETFCVLVRQVIRALPNPYEEKK
jgi:hypothetical protein